MKGRILLVLKTHRELDNQCCSQALAAGMEVENNVAYPLITKKVTGEYLLRWVGEWEGGRE